MNIKNKIKQIREIHKLNQSEFAERLGVTQKIISNLESGKNEPSLQLIKNLTITFAYPTITFAYLIITITKLL